MGFFNVVRVEGCGGAKARSFLAEAGLIASGYGHDEYWVAEAGGEIIGAAGLKRSQGFEFLSSVGVLKKFRKMGVARKIVERVINSQKRDMYLYTVIPSFFEKFGFVAVPSPAFVPERRIFGCDDCEESKCLCMVRKIC